jgi:adenine-specific DNA-methyltransferase
MDMNFKNHLYDVLKADARIWNEETKEFNETLLKDLIDKLDEKIVGLLLDDSQTKEKFFLKIKDAFILKQQNLKFFIDENKLDNSYTKYRNKIGLRAGNKLLTERDEVVLDWPFKDTVLEGGMTKEDQKRNEIFFNEVLAQDEIDRLLDPKALANWKRHTKDGEEKVKEIKRDADGTIRENLIIKGNNLLALHTLKEQFAGKVKLIYIDPPYYFKENKDADTFTYNSNFKLSSWLVFMRNRLKIAKQLLTKDGFIAVQTNGDGLPYLKILMDSKDLFGSDNSKSIITVKVKDAAGVGQQSFIFDTNEYILVYAKDWNTASLRLPEYKELEEVTEQDKNYKNIIKSFGNPKFIKIINRKNIGEIKIYECENSEINRSTSIKTNEYIENRNIIAADYNPSGGTVLQIIEDIPASGLSYIEYIPTKGKNAGKITKTYFLNRRILSFVSDVTVEKEGKIYKSSVITNLWEMTNASLHLEGGVVLKGGKKPEELIEKVIRMITQEGDIVLDFFVGSGTTAAVSHKLKLQYIGVEQLEDQINKTVIRLKNVINGEQSGISKKTNWKQGGNFVYLELARWNEEAKEKILNASGLEELETLFDELYERYFLNYNVKTKEFKEKTLKEEEFKSMSLDEQKKLFVEMLDMNQIYVNFSERKDSKYKLSSEDIALSEEFYNSNK